MEARGRQSRTANSTGALLIFLTITCSAVAAADAPSAQWDRSSTLGPVHAELAQGEVRVLFRSDAHGLDAGYFLYRLDESGAPVLVNEEMVPVPPTPGGVLVAVADRQASIDASLTYAIVAVGVDGIERSFGPFAARRVDEGHRFRLDDAGTPGKSSRGSREDRVDGKATPRVRGERRHGAGNRGRESELSLRLEISERGLYYVAAQEIESASGVSAKRLSHLISRGKLQLRSGAGSVSWLPANKGAGLFFFGDTPGNDFSRANVYWLEEGRGRVMGRLDGGAPAPAVPTSGPEAVHFERDEFPVTVTSSGSAVDFYYWSYIVAGNPAYGSAVHEFEIDDRAVFSRDAVLELDLQGVTSTPANPEHEARVLVNGTLVGSTVWDGALPHRARIEVPANVLVEGTNELVVSGTRLPGAPYSAFLVDGFDLTLERWHRSLDGGAIDLGISVAGVQTVIGFDADNAIVLEVTDPINARLVSGLGFAEGPGGPAVAFVAGTPGSKYFVADTSRALAVNDILAVDTSPLVDEVAGAEYLIITPSALREGAEKLGSYRAGDGLSVYVADLEDVYDAFGAGLVSPRAIRDFVSHAYQSWATTPRFVTLIGAGTFDYLDAEGLGSSLLPPYMASTPYGYYSWDGFYADVVGNDLIPDVALGRIPVQTMDELTAYVDKLHRFEHLGWGIGADDLLLLADNPDGAGDYPVESDALQPLVPDWASTERIYLSEQWIGQARANLMTSLEGGTAWVNYVGHGSLDRFASEGLLTAQDVSAMSVIGRLPAVSAMTCSVGRFEVPGWTSLATEMILAPDGGAGAVFAPSGQSLSFEAKIINQALFEALYSIEAGTVGEAVVHALRSYAEEGRFDFMMQIYNLVGDPAYRVR